MADQTSAFVRPALFLQIIRREWMTVLAMGFSGIPCRDAIPAQDIFATTTDFQMIRADTAAHPAQMIEGQSIRDGAAQEFIDGTVSFPLIVSRRPMCLSVSFILFGFSHPNPASAFGHDFNLAGEASGQIGEVHREPPINRMASA
jgi:hypothetical protein